MGEAAQLAQSFREQKKQYTIFDCNSWLPGSNEDLLVPVDGLEGLRCEWKAAGIDRAVLSDKACLTVSPEKGNERIVSLLAKENSLWGGAVVCPLIDGGLCETRLYIGQLIDRGMVLARVFPKRFRHSMQAWQAGDLLTVLEEHRLPMMIWHTQTGWDELEELASAYPALPIIIAGNDQKLLYHTQSFLRLLARHENLYMDTHNLTQYHLLEYLFDRALTDRLLYGSDLPYNDPHASLYYILYASIPDKEKRKILSGNLERLIRGIAR